jgi:hypothetical protein
MNREVDMAQERLTMRKIREILRLKYEAGLSNRAIAGACKVSNSTVGEYLRRAKAAGVSWPMPEMEEEELYRELFPDVILTPGKKQTLAGLGRSKKRAAPKRGDAAAAVDGIQGEISARLSIFTIL